MNRVLDPSLAPEEPAQEVDALLSAFFRAEMPDPWPTFQAPAPPVVPLPPRRPPTWPRWRSRLALAASVALLVLSALALPGKLAPTTGGPVLRRSDGTADTSGMPGHSRPSLEGKVREVNLEQGDDGTGIRLRVEEGSSPK
jgi:hypothetical protein